MANRTETANLSSSNFVDSTSRYINSEVIRYGDKRLLTFETYKRNPLLLSPDDRFLVINKGVEFRPDLVSFRVYGVVSLWWRIMEANNIFDVFDFKAGRNIRLPNNIFQI